MQSSNVMFGNFVNHIGSFWATSICIVHALRNGSARKVPSQNEMIYLYISPVLHVHTSELNLCAVARGLIVTCGDCIDPGSSLLTAVTSILMRIQYFFAYCIFCTLHIYISTCTYNISLTHITLYLHYTLILPQRCSLQLLQY